MIDKAPDTNELLRRIEALEKQARILPSEFSSGQEDLLHGVLNDRLKSQQHESRDHLNRGLNPLKITPGTNGQVLTTTTAAGQVDATWFTPPSCLIWRNATHPDLITAGATAYVDYTDTLHSDGSITADPANDRITFTLPGKYLIGYNLLWRAAGSAVLINGSSVIELNGTTDIAYNEHLGYNTGGFSNHANTIYEFAAGDYIKVRYSWGGAAGSHGIYSEATSIGHRVCGLYAHWISPA